MTVIQNNTSKRDIVFFMGKTCLSCVLFGDSGAFCGDGFVYGAFGFVFVYRAKNGVRFHVGNFKQIGDRFVDLDIEITVVINAARECAAGPPPDRVLRR